MPSMKTTAPPRMRENTSSAIAFRRWSGSSMGRATNQSRARRRIPLKFTAQLHQLVHRVPVAPGARRPDRLLDHRVGQLGSADAPRVMQVEILSGQLHPLGTALEAAERLGRAGGRRAVDEQDQEVAGIVAGRIRKRVRGDRLAKLVEGSEEDPGPEAAPLLDGLLETLQHLGAARALAAEDHVPALQEGTHAGVTEPLAELGELRHLDQVAPAAIDGAEHGAEDRHGRCIPQEMKKLATEFRTPAAPADRRWARGQRRTRKS